jgi:hypothetical protein
MEIYLQSVFIENEIYLIFEDDFHRLYEQMEEYL